MTPIPEIDLNQIADENMRQLVRSLLNIIEELSADNGRLREDNQQLRDEINRFKGEHGKPNIKPGKPQQNHSSEKERGQPRRHQKKSKRSEIRIEREEVLAVDRAHLPPDAVFKGYEDVVVQEIALHTDNILFRKERFYSASEGKTYLAALPAGYAGAFGPNLRTQVLILYYACQMTEPKIRTWLEQLGIDISEGTISNMLIKGHTAFHEEEASSYDASLANCPWQHIDETGTRVNGENHYCHIVDSPLATHYQTTPTKSRLDVLKVLRNRRPVAFRNNDAAWQLVKALRVPKYALRQLLGLCPNREYSAAFMSDWLDRRLPKLSNPHRVSILSSLAVAAYHASTGYPVVRLLLCDDAPQFQWVTEELALCWIHEGRHYKKLSPVVPAHQRAQKRFLQAFWRFYRTLNRYRDAPTPEKATWLGRYFDRLFGTRTGYADLDKLIARTQRHKTHLLMALTHPEIPLHNNPAELGARQRVRKRKISFGPRVAEGVKAWDTFMSLVETTRKLGVNFLDYILDRIMGTGNIPSLPDLIVARARQLDPGASWQGT